MRSRREQSFHFLLLTVVEVKRILRSVWNFSSGYWLSVLRYFNIEQRVWWFFVLFYYTTIGVCCPALLISVAFCIVYIFFISYLNFFPFSFGVLCPMLSTLPCPLAFLYCVVHYIAVLLPFLVLSLFFTVLCTALLFYCHWYK